MSTDEREVGWLHIKPEYILPPDPVDESIETDDRDNNKKRKRGQNKNRKQANVREPIILCHSYAQNVPCPFGEKYLRLRKYFDRRCRNTHSLADYMAQKQDDIGDVCPVFEAIGKCKDGWRCCWLSGHIRKVDEGEEGGLEGWKLVEDSQRAAKAVHEELNRVSPEEQKALRHNKIPLPLSTEFLRILEEQDRAKSTPQTAEHNTDKESELRRDNESLAKEENLDEDKESLHREHRAAFTNTSLRPMEKRRINWSGLHVLAPLTTLGNPPFRRLTRQFGAQLTYSEMALSQTLLQGQRQEWALARAHPSETYTHTGPPNSYYGIQIAGGKVPTVVKTAELLTKVCGNEEVSGIDTIDLNCGCPLDMVFKAGAGSALMDNQGRLARILRGMVAVTGDIPVTCKIRMGVSTGKNTAEKFVRRLVVDNIGVSAVTLHGRSRQQRYSRAADWKYIAECAAIIKRAKEEMAHITDSGYHNLEYGESQRMAFIGNGDVYSHTDFYNAIEHSNVDTSMVARGAIVKPWIFEEISLRQHLDKSATERLDMLRQFAYWGLEHWGSDVFGVAITRRFFCEFMSFFHRYVPLGILDHQSIPPHLHDRAPKWCGRSDLETLLASRDSKDWVKISEMFIGKAPEGWQFTPKHKSNSVEAEG